MGIWHPAGVWELRPRRGRLVLKLHWTPVARGRRRDCVQHCYMIATGPGPVLMLGRSDGVVGWLVYRHALF